MNIQSSLKSLFIAASIVTLASCAGSASTSGSASAGGSSAESSASVSAQASASAGNAAGGTTYDHGQKKVYQAVKSAMAVVGCSKMRKDTDTYVECKRPNKMGAFVGSGGEIIKVSIAAVSESQTSVNVQTKKTFMGIAGQKNWDQPMADEIAKALAQ